MFPAPTAPSLVSSSGRTCRWPWTRRPLTPARPSCELVRGADPAPSSGPTARFSDRGVTPAGTPGNLWAANARSAPGGPGAQSVELPTEDTQQFVVDSYHQPLPCVRRGHPGQVLASLQPRYAPSPARPGDPRLTAESVLTLGVSRCGPLAGLLTTTLPSTEGPSTPPLLEKDTTHSARAGGWGPGGGGWGPSTSSRAP